MTILEKKGYALKTITRLDVEDSENKFKELPASEGLFIEKKCSDDSNSYFAIISIKMNDNKDDILIESISDRILYVEEEDWTLVKSMINVAKGILRISNEED